MQVSSGHGLAAGKVTYTKVPGGKGGQAVKVTGTLTSPGLKGKGGLTLTEGKYTVKVMLPINDMQGGGGEFEAMKGFVVKAGDNQMPDIRVPAGK